MKEIIATIVRNADEVRQGAYHPDGGGSHFHIFYRKGRDVVVTQSNGDFVTILKDGINNGWFNGATTL